MFPHQHGTGNKMQHMTKNYMAIKWNKQELLSINMNRARKHTGGVEKSKMQRTDGLWHV